MSRLIVKNLPNSITSEKLKECFSSQGVVTDVQLKYTLDGKFRHFGFIGFQTTEDANKAAEYFNNTYINQSKISVQHCAELGDASKPKAWSKYAPDSSAFKKLHTEEDKGKKKNTKEKVSKPKDGEKIKKEKKINPEVEERLKKHKGDPLFREFMEAHTKEDGVLKVIKDDKDSGVDEAASEENEMEEEYGNKTEDNKSSAFDSISDLEYMKSKKKSAVKTEDSVKIKENKLDVKQSEENATKMFTVKVTNLAYSTKKRELKEFFCPLKPAGMRLPRKTSGFAYVTFKTSREMKKALNKNKSFLRGKQIGVKEYTEKSEEEQQITSIKNEKQKRWKEQEEALLQEENIGESGSIFVRNLAYSVSEEELTQHFATFGPLADVTMPVDRETRKYKGFATITFMMPEHALAAYTKLDGTVFHGRMLHLLPAKTKPSPEQEEEDKSFKDKKRDKQKASAGQSHNWNTLFLCQKAVVDVLANKYDVSKQDMLTGPDVAVRLALGETKIVSETRKFLLDSGVSLDAFNQAPKTRSKTVILVKNLPANTTASEMQEIFSKFGELGRVVLPPSGVTAIVEFLETSEAKKAFMNLAYTRFKHEPLYLEWAPDDTFSPVTVKDQNSNKTEVNGEDDKSKKNDRLSDEEEIDLEPEPETTLYVKNLNFDTTEDSLKKHFNGCGRVCSVTIARKKDPARPGQLLSMGYGFIQFYRQSQVAQALKQLQLSSLDGHQLELKRSNRTLQDDAAVSRKKNNVQKQTGTKILVRNIAFQASEKEVLQLFKTFGEIKSMRLPKKMVGTGPHRGFAFVEFYNKYEARRAMQELCQSTHFFGRRLVLEWAQQDETVEQLRKRTAQNFRPESTPGSKKARADLEIENEEANED